MEESLRPACPPRELDRIAERHIRSARATPSFLDYLGGRRYDARDPHAYPASTCISHRRRDRPRHPGRPRGQARARSCRSTSGVIYDGWHGDGARSFICGGEAAGRPRPPAWCESTRLALMAGIAAARPGNRLGDISAAVEDVAPRGRVRDHPPVRGPRHRDRDARGPARAQLPDPQPAASSSRRATASRSSRCSPSAREDTDVLDDGWTVVTADGSLAAHFEHTIAVTEHGPGDPDECLTQRPRPRTPAVAAVVGLSRAIEHV